MVKNASYLRILIIDHTERTAEEAFKEGADYYIVKPIQMESLKDFIVRLARDKMTFHTKGGYRINWIGGSGAAAEGRSSDKKSIEISI